jgi:hypothetical protein
MWSEQVIVTSYRAFPVNMTDSLTEAVTSPSFQYADGYHAISRVTLYNLKPGDVINLQFCGHALNETLAGE